MKAKTRKGKKSAPVTVGTVSTDSRAALPVVQENMFSDETLGFWRCHGINHILSDYAAGTWTPMFPAIYDSDEAPYPSSEEITKAIMDRYNADIDHWPSEAKSALAWAVQDRTIVYVYYKEALRRLTAAHGGDADIEGFAKAPHNPIVWGLFAYLKDNVLRKATSQK